MILTNYDEISTIQTDLPHFLQCLAADTPASNGPQMFNNIRNASSNLASAISNQIASGMNRTANLVNQMTDVLAITLNTTKQLSLIDQTQVLGGRLSNASAQFLNATSHTVAAILNANLNAINAMVSAKTNIGNAILQISSRFLTRTGQLLSNIMASSSLPPVIPKSISAVTDRLLKTSINLVNSTDNSLANVINATSQILAKSLDDHNQVVTKVLNSTARLVNSTTESLGNLLNTTNHLIAGVIQSRVNASNAILNETSNLLNASSQAISSFLNATTLIINNAPNDRNTRDGPVASLSALDTARNGLSAVFNRTSDLLHGVLAAERNIQVRLVNATDALLQAALQIKSTLINATRDLSNNATNSVVSFVESAITSTANEAIAPSANSNSNANVPLSDEIPIDAAPVIDNPAIVDANVVQSTPSNADNANLLNKETATDDQKLKAP